MYDFLLKVGPLLTHIKATFKDVQLIIVVLNGKSMVYGKPWPFLFEKC